MKIGISFVPSAFDHKVSEEDIKMAFDKCQYDGFVDEDDPDADNKNLLIDERSEAASVLARTWLSK